MTNIKTTKESEESEGSDLEVEEEEVHTKKKQHKKGQEIEEIKNENKKKEHITLQQKDMTNEEIEKKKRIEDIWNQMNPKKVTPTHSTTTTTTTTTNESKNNILPSPKLTETKTNIFSNVPKVIFLKKKKNSSNQNLSNNVVLD